MKELNNYATKYKNRDVEQDASGLGAENSMVGVPECKLPVSAVPLVNRVHGDYHSAFWGVVEKVEARGVTVENQYRFKLQWDGNRVYIPVFFDGKMVNYVGRAAWWTDTTLRRYQYFPGASTRNYIFNWDSVRLWDYVVLVENTFNGIWLSDHFHCTSNFGSDLSKIQIEQIASSKLKKVIFLWDEGAEWAAGRARHRLKALGIASTVLKIQGQPDNHTVDELKPWVEYALQNCSEKAIIDTCPQTK